MKDMGFVIVFVRFCVNTLQFCLCKTNNSILGLYLKYRMGNETDQLSFRVGPISIYPSFAFSLKKKNYCELENESLDFKCRKE